MSERREEEVHRSSLWTQKLQKALATYWLSGLFAFCFACSSSSQARLSLNLPSFVTAQFSLAPHIDVPEGFQFSHLSLSYVVKSASGKIIVDSADVTQRRISLAVPKERLDVEFLYSALALNPAKKSEFCESAFRFKSSDIRFYRSIFKKQLDATQGGQISVDFPELEKVELFRIAASLAAKESQLSLGLLDPLTGKGLVPLALGCTGAYISQMKTQNVLLVPALYSPTAVNLVAKNQDDSEAVLNLDLSSRIEGKAASVAIASLAREGTVPATGFDPSVKQGLSQILNSTLLDEAFDSDNDGSTDLAELLRESDPFVADRTFYQSDAKPLPPVISVALNTINGIAQNDGRPVWSWKLPADSRVPYSGKFRYSFSAADFESSSKETAAFQFQPSSALADGSHTLYLKALGSNSVYSDLVSATFVVDRTPPAKPVLSVPLFFKETRPLLSWSKAGPVNGDNGSGLFRFWFDSEDLGVVKQETYLNTAVPLGDLNEGAHRFYVQEVDAAGNWSEPAVGNFVIDSLAPAAPVVSLDASNRQRPVWNYALSVDTVKVVYRLSTSSSPGADLAAETGGATNLSFASIENLPEGPVTFYIKAIDAAGNESTPAESSFVVDVTPPAPPSIAVAAAVTNSKRPAFNFSSSEPDATRGDFRLKFGNSDFSSGALSQLGNTFVPDSDLADGTHTLFVSVGDIYGNYSLAASRSVTVECQRSCKPDSNCTIASFMNFAVVA